METSTKRSHVCRQNSLNNVLADPKPLSNEVALVVTSMMGRDYSHNTKKAIEADIKNFLVWYEAKNEESFSFSRIIQRDVLDYRRDSQTSGLSVATINRRLVTIRRFLAEAIATGRLSVNPADGVKQLPVQGLAPKGIGRAVLRKLLREAEIRGDRQLLVMMELMSGAGLRVSEVASLRTTDVALGIKSGYVIVRNSKGNRTRKVPLNLSIRNHLGALLSDVPNGSHIFIGQRGPLTSFGIAEKLRKMVIMVLRRGDEEITPHTLRHAFAYSYLKANPSDIVGLAQILGHSNINTTAIYTQNRLEDLQERMERVF